MVLAEAWMQSLVEDMLLLARTDEHAAPQRAAVDLDDLVFEEATRLRSTTAVRVDTTAVRGGAGTRGNRGAAAAWCATSLTTPPGMPRAASIWLCPSTAATVRLTIDDDGPGIPESEWERVLKRFVRLDEARSRDDGGSGLGLAIVDEVVRDHGGSVSMGQSPTGGARVEVTLPSGQG